HLRLAWRGDRRAGHPGGDRRTAGPADFRRRGAGQGVPGGRAGTGRRRAADVAGQREGDGPVKALLISAAVSMAVALLGTPIAIRVFTRQGYGQPIREEGPAGHANKRGTPTMGGTVMIIATLIGYF